MTADPANFRKDDLEAVYPDWQCQITGIFARSTANLPLELRLIDPNHILGRNRGDRVYSSVLNCFPLVRKAHDFAHVEDRWLRMFMLEFVQKKVEIAIIAGRYEYRDVDYAFMEVRREWELKQFPRG
jgi:hypothetical protein